MSGCFVPEAKLQPAYEITDGCHVRNRCKYMSEQEREREKRDRERERERERERDLHVCIYSILLDLQVLYYMNRASRVHMV